MVVDDRPLKVSYLFYIHRRRELFDMQFHVIYISLRPGTCARF